MTMTAIRLRRFSLPDDAARAIRLVVAAGVLLALAVFVALAPLRWAIAGLAGCAALLGLLIKPATGLVLIALAIPWNRAIPLALPGAAGIVDVLVTATGAAWLARGVARRAVVVRRTPLAGPLHLLAWVAGLSLTQAFSWREGLPEWLKWGEFVLLYVAAAHLLGPRSRPVLIAALLAAGLSQVALGAYQFVRQVGPEAFILNGRFMRAYGSFEQPNPYAGYLGYLAPVVASLALGALGAWWRTRKIKNTAVALGLAAATAGLAGGIVISWSRGAWVGLAAAFVVVAGMRSRVTAVLTGVAVGLLVVVTVVLGTGWLPGPIGSRVSDLGSYVSGPDPARTEIDDANFSVLERLAHWRAGLAMFDDHPWLGVGIGNYGTAYPTYALPRWYEPLGHAHNAFINFLAETGALGFAAFLTFWLGIAGLTVRRCLRGGPGSALAAGLLGAWVYLTVHSLFDNLFVQHMQLQLALLLGALAGLPVESVAGRAAGHT